MQSKVPTIAKWRIRGEAVIWVAITRVLNFRKGPQHVSCPVKISQCHYGPGLRHQDAIKKEQEKLEGYLATASIQALALCNKWVCLANEEAYKNGGFLLVNTPIQATLKKETPTSCLCWF